MRKSDRLDLASDPNSERDSKSDYCNVIGVINKRVSSQDPDHFTYGIGFALNLPNTWLGRFEMMGGGGTDGSLNADPQGSAGVELTNGWAVAADDGGHEDNANNLVRRISGRRSERRWRTTFRRR